MENIEVQPIESTGKFKVHYHAPNDIVAKKREEAFDKFAEKDARNLTLKGFRKGHAPKFALRLAVGKEYKQYFESKVADLLLQEAVQQVQYQTGWKLLFQPEVNDLQMDEKTFACELTVCKRPDVKLGEYKGMIIPKPHLEGTLEQQVEATLQKIRVENGDNEPFGDDDTIRLTDKVTMDVEAKEGDAILLSQEGTLYTVGDQQIHPKLDEQLIGMKAGEEKEFVTSEDDHTVNWKVKVHMGLHVVPCGLDDTLAEKVGLKDLAELREKVTGYCQHQQQQEERTQLKQQILLRLVEATETEIPQYLLDLELELMLRQRQMDAATLSEGDRKFFEDLAGRQIKLALAFDQISQEVPDLQFSDGEVLENLKQKIQESGQDADKMIQEAAEAGSLPGVIASLKHESVVEWLIQQAQVVE